MNEAEANERIEEWLRTYPTVIGQHCYDSRFARLPGWPDWEFIGPHGVLYREFKGSDDVLLPEQRRIGRVMMRAGLDWRVWWSRDIANGTAERQIEEIS